MKLCPECGKQLVLVGEAAAKFMEPSESIDFEEGVTKYFCANKNCKYYNKSLAWDNSKEKWKRLPK